jgi:hypothetical protein
MQFKSSPRYINISLLLHLIFIFLLVIVCLLNSLLINVLFFICFFRNLKTLFLEEGSIIESDSEWLHELALSNTVLETLNFYMTDLAQVRFARFAISIQCI